jgi:hypothetical protein
MYHAVVFVADIEGQGLAELSKDKPVTKQVEASTTHFMQALEGIEINLVKHISYLTTVSTGRARLYCDKP